MKKGQTNMVVIIMVTIILAMVSISIVWGLIRSQQDTTAIKNDTFTTSNTSCVRLTNNCYIANSLTVDNLSTDHTGNFTECGSSSMLYGTIGAANWPLASGDLMNASYTEQACGRITGLTGTIINYVPLLMAVLILVFVAGFAIK